MTLEALREGGAGARGAVVGGLVAVLPIVVGGPWLVWVATTSLFKGLLVFGPADAPPPPPPPPAGGDGLGALATGADDDDDEVEEEALGARH